MANEKIDVSQLTQEINLFRQIEDERSISPDSLGALLLKMAGSIGTGRKFDAGEIDDVDLLRKWADKVKAIGEVIHDVWVAEPTATGVKIGYNKSNLATGQTGDNRSQEIPTATATAAGLMSAEDKNSLIKLAGTAETIAVTELDLARGTLEEFCKSKAGSAVYKVVSDRRPAGVLLMFADSASHQVTQLLISHYTEKGANSGFSEHSDTEVSILVRSYGLTSPNIENGTWLPWQHINAAQRQAIATLTSQMLTKLDTHEFDDFKGRANSEIGELNNITEQHGDMLTEHTAKIKEHDGYRYEIDTVYDSIESLTDYNTLYTKPAIAQVEQNKKDITSLRGSLTIEKQMREVDDEELRNQISYLDGRADDNSADIELVSNRLDAHEADAREIMRRLIPTGLTVSATTNLTLGNVTPNHIKATLTPPEVAQNIIYISDNNAVSVAHNGLITLLREGRGTVTIIPTLNTALAQQLTFTVTRPTARMATQGAMRLTANGSIRLN